jgi:hypothetical protein
MANEEEIMSAADGSKETIAARDAAVGPTHQLGAVKTSIPVYPEDGTPQAGTNQPAGKSSQPDAVLRTGLQPKSEAVQDCKCVDGAARKAIDTQVNGSDGNANGNPKKRNASSWGRKIESQA